MRPVFKLVLMLSTIAGVASSQALTDAVGVIAGGSVGVGAGKKVGEGIAGVLGKVDSTTAKAAKTEKSGAPAAKSSEKG